MPLTEEPIDIPSEPELIGVARLDSQGVYLGVDVIEKAAKAAEHVEVPIDCDLTPGRYQLKDGVFVHIAKPRPATDTPPVIALNALAWMMLALWDAKTVTLPEATLQWLDFYVTTIDFGISSVGMDDLVYRYRASRTK